MLDAAALATLLVVMAVVAIVLLVRSMVILQPHQTGVLTVFGSFRRVLNPGLTFVPVFARVVRIDMRTQRWEVPSTAAITLDGVPAESSSIVEARVSDPVRALFQVPDFRRETVSRAQVAVRTVLGKVAAAEITPRQDELAGRIGALIAEDARGWGIEVLSIELKGIRLGPPPSSPLPGQK